jgi:hypothetical protein
VTARPVDARRLPSHHREHFTLRANPRRGSKIVIFAITQDNGSPPQLATSERTIHIH